MRTSSAFIALLLASAALTAQAGPAAERNTAAVGDGSAFSVFTYDALGATPRVDLHRRHVACEARTETKAVVGVGSPFSVLTYDALGATPRVEFGRRRVAPDAAPTGAVAAR